jgi:transposase
MLLKKRIYVEHTLNKFKQYKKIQLRYEKKINNFNFFVYLAALRILIKKTNCYLC